MRYRSRKREAAHAETAAYRRQLVEQTGTCMVCGPAHKHRMPPLNNLCCHEILNGPLRRKVLTEPSCLIVCCWHCNQHELDDKSRWPLARQLALIKHKAPDRYDRQRVLLLRDERAPDFVTEDEVDAYPAPDADSV